MGKVIPFHSKKELEELARIKRIKLSLKKIELIIKGDKND